MNKKDYLKAAQALLNIHANDNQKVFSIINDRIQHFDRINDKWSKEHWLGTMKAFHLLAETKMLNRCITKH